MIETLSGLAFVLTDGVPLHETWLGAVFLIVAIAAPIFVGAVTIARTKWWPVFLVMTVIITMVPFNGILFHQRDAVYECMIEQQNVDIGVGFHQPANLTWCRGRKTVNEPFTAWDLRSIDLVVE